MKPPKIAIVEYGLGNIFSLTQACHQVGLETEVTSDPSTLKSSAGVILPGVGAFGDAMSTLQKLGLVDTLKEIANQGTPLFGICLGMQLLLDESDEFGSHKGLGLVPGVVRRFNPTHPNEQGLRVPHVGWSPIFEQKTWKGSPLEDLDGGRSYYFVHSYYALPKEKSDVLATSRYGELNFCSAIQKNSVFGFQFHPEKSGDDGIAIYRGIKWVLEKR